MKTISNSSSLPTLRCLNSNENLINVDSLQSLQLSNEMNEINISHNENDISCIPQQFEFECHEIDTNDIEVEMIDDCLI